MMKNLIKGLYNKLRYYKLCIDWINQYRTLKKKYLYLDNCKKEKKDILIIVPHADDELIGCYQLIKNNIENVRLFYCGYTGSNVKIENKLIRLLEFQTFCKDMKIKYVISSENIKEDLRKLIIEYSPEVILLPSCIDWHHEHREINYTLKSILYDLKIKINIMWFYISVPANNKIVNYIYPLNRKDQIEKWKKFSNFYLSQKHIPIKRFKYVERISGYMNSCFAAEVFYFMELDIWRNTLEVLKLPKIENQLDNLNIYINNLKNIYSEIDKIYILYNI